MKKWKLFGMLFLLLFLVGCGKQNDTEKTKYTIYDVDRDDNKVLSYDANVNGTDTRQILQELFVLLKREPEKNNERSAIPSDVTLKSYSLNENRLVLDFSGEYLNQTNY